MEAEAVIKRIDKNKQMAVSAGKFDFRIDLKSGDC